MRPTLLKKMRPSPASVVAIAALVVALGGIAYATIPDSGSVIHGCYDRRGNLKVIDTGKGQSCTKGWTPLAWNQTGPQGPQGAPGANGATGQTGPAGPPGPSETTYWKTGGGVLVPDNPVPGNDPVVVRLTDLPPGNYLVTASVQFATTTHTIFACRYEGPTGTLGDTQETMNPQPGELQMEENITVHALVDLPEGGEIPIHCYSNPYDYSQSGTNRSNTMWESISATKQGTLVRQG